MLSLDATIIHLAKKGSSCNVLDHKLFPQTIDALTFLDSYKITAKPSLSKQLVLLHYFP